MKDPTKVITTGRNPDEQFGAVNPPVVHASTVLFPTSKELSISKTFKYRYGRHGMPTQHALMDAMADLEGGHKAILSASGLAAVTTALHAFLSAGDHLLMVDTVYGPTRAFCNKHLARFGVETTYYDPLIGAGIENLVKPNTKVVFTESPGSRTFEMQDIPGISAAVKSRGDITVMTDNTWATPLYFKAFDKGVDVSIHAATKYIVGHSDAMLGVVVTNESHWDQLLECNQLLGGAIAPDDAYLGLRGLRTLNVRLKQHSENAAALTAWLNDQPEVSRILYPAWPTDPGYSLWKRDYQGATGLFGFIMKGGTKKISDQFLDALNLYGMGFSWGGFESLMIPNSAVTRTATAWTPEGLSFRCHAGLEDVSDLIADLDQAFDVFRKDLA
jgi:cysteine-S-conjugate beta-lyase